MELSSMHRLFYVKMLMTKKKILILWIMYLIQILRMMYQLMYQMILVFFLIMLKMIVVKKVVI